MSKTHISNCLIDISTWISSRNLKFNMLTSESLTFSHQPIPPWSSSSQPEAMSPFGSSTLKCYSLKLFSPVFHISSIRKFLWLYLKIYLKSDYFSLLALLLPCSKFLSPTWTPIIASCLVSLHHPYPSAAQTFFKK